MNIETQVLDLFEEGNPIPDLDGLEPIDLDAAAYLATLEQRSSEVTQVHVEKEDQKQKKTVRPWLVAAGITILAGVALLVINQEDKTPVAGPTATVESYIEAYNAGDIDLVMTHFTEDSVITGHPFDASSTGLTEIQAVQVQDIAAAASENAYTISNVEVTGDTVTWDHVWTNSEGNDFCQFGQSAVVEEGIILSWTWPSGGGDCP